MMFILTVAALASMLGAIRAAEQGSQRQLYIFKPLTTVLILAIAAADGTPPSGYYQWMIVTGLFFSLAGDIFLMLPGDRFIAGLASFFVAHVVYIAAFAPDLGPSLLWWPALPLALYTGVLVPVLIPRAA